MCVCDICHKLLVPLVDLSSMPVIWAFVGPNGLVDLYLNIISQLTCVIKRDPSVGPNGFVDLYPNIISQLACVLLKGTPMLGLMA